MALSRRQAVALTLAAASAPRAALGQTAPMKIVFPFAAGGTGDALSRFIADKLSTALKRPVIVENRTGADGRIAIQSVKASPPDGSTWLVTTGPSMALMPQIHKTPGYDPEADFVPVANLARFEFCVAVANSVPAMTVAELVSWIKANPEKATYGLPGLGTIPHFAGVAWSKLIGADMRRLAYRGGSPAVNDLVGGQIPMAVLTLSDVLQQYRAGTVKILAVLSRSRSPFEPTIPTLIESGYPIEGEAWYGMWAPAGTSAETVAAVGKLIGHAMAEPESKARFMNLGLILTGSPAAELEATRKAMAETWAPTIKSSGFTMEQ